MTAVARPVAGPEGRAAISPDEFRSVFRGHPAGVAVVAMRDGERPVGFTATSVISVSADPPLLAFSLATTSSSWPAVARASTVAVSFLAHDQADLSARFATSGVDRFADGGWHALDSGEPVIDGAAAWVRARVVERTAVGSSHLVTLHAVRRHVRDGASPLVFHDRGYHRLGDRSRV
ncbi:flavin reductase family protein [Isoptericola sp. NPDC057191]|uniref:flavin reductase family protein n=1 Tax=Isoptericola sp. NPDC057191 TaxID=3346041 RepID=UPI00363B8AD7